MSRRDESSTVILATARARLDRLLATCEQGIERTENEAVAAHLTRITEPLKRAVTALSEAIAASVGHGPQSSAKTPCACKPRAGLED